MTQFEVLNQAKTELSPGFEILRGLPQRALRRIGAWIFLDHLGPVQVTRAEQLHVHSHPHIGLQTFTWMIEGEIEHKDSLGYHQTIQAGQINLMTAGNGIAHTEISLNPTGRLHSAQLWIALPDSHKNMPAAFENYPNLLAIKTDESTQTILVGSWQGQTSSVKVHTPLIAVDILSQQTHQVTLPLNPDFEYGLMALEGNFSIEQTDCDASVLVYLPKGQTEVNVHLPANSRVLLIGGEPMQEELIVWWNLVARTQAEIEQAREDWQNQSERFGNLSLLGDGWLQAPLINGTLKASGPRS
ncbi:MULTISPECIES: pirin family protein [Vitreoscilla]|uniref:Pirin family protein n=1 Tax=Vitreoscilla stercoraria TaxID=61 RepID=A0ABY4E6Z8_VITST|nr:MULTISPECIES: pirin family protein [Vitreoscilla]AUZ04768.1 pirin [Vitreoscilla sp. C1]UOO91556.1 pirin family protein [Vitreoscilla stercoraria]